MTFPAVMAPSSRRGVQTLALIIASLGGAALVCYLLLDQPAIAPLARETQLWDLDSNRWVTAFRQLGKAWVPLWLLLLVASRRPRPALTGLLALALLSITILPLKPLVARPRPNMIPAIRVQMGIDATDPHLQLGRWQTSWSFPSGDAATVFAVAAALSAFINWPGKVVLFAMATMISALRVVALAHYPSDVCAGAAVGILCGWMALLAGLRLLPPDPWRSYSMCRLGATAVALGLLLSCLFTGQPYSLKIFVNTCGLPIGVVYLVAILLDWRQRRCPARAT
jgi:membrane-associated phospholipid phosphatase